MAKRAWTYGLTVEQVRTLFVDSPMCQLCRARPSTDIDHDHTTGKIRGVLCQVCNTGLGKFRDDPELLLRAAEWVSIGGS